MPETFRRPSLIPIPDPSVVTVQEIAKVRSELREEFKSLMQAQSDLLVAGSVGRHEKATLRVEAIEKAHRLFEDNLNRVPTQLDRETARLMALFDEKFKGVAIRIDSFHEYAAAMRENANKTIEASFIASEKLSNGQRGAFEQQIAKSESSATKEIDGLKTLISTTRDATAADIANLTGRLDRGEGGDRGARQATNDHRASIGSNAVVLTCVCGFLVLLVAIVSVGISLHGQAAAMNPTIGADTKRVDDLIAVITEQNRQVGQRMDALSARLNALTLPPKP